MGRLVATLVALLWAVSPQGAAAQTGASAPTAGACSADMLDLRDDDTQLRFRTEVMDTPETRAQGLMFRESLPRFSGMLFVYDAAGPVSFWMENTLIPLDMLFFDGAGVLVRIHENAVPRDRTAIFGGEEIRYVLEINGGLTRALGIDLGAELRHAALAQDAAAWSCAAP